MEYSHEYILGMEKFKVCHVECGLLVCNRILLLRRMEEWNNPNYT